MSTKGRAKTGGWIVGLAVAALGGVGWALGWGDVAAVVLVVFGVCVPLGVNRLLRRLDGVLIRLPGGFEIDLSDDEEAG